MTALDPRALRNAFGTFMTGVTVVTSHDAEGAPLGFTANSFTSVSLDPPLVLICLANSSQNYDALVSAGGFAVNILSEAQIEISNTFARPSKDRFAGIKWQNGPHGAPLLADVSAWFDCAMHKTVDAGDHVILIGEVKAFGTAPNPGLGYARGAYITPAATTDALSPHANLIVSALIAYEDTVLLVDDGTGGANLPQTIVRNGELPSAALRRLIASTGLPAEPGFIYSVFEDTGLERHHIAFLCRCAGGVPQTGNFVPISQKAFDDVSDTAVLSMLERYAAETRLGHLGIYYGTQNRGEVRAII
jgi:flavin reductase (DIM6/NTAB) family NADH-FMN oxidoreductase RutF